MYISLGVQHLSSVAQTRRQLGRSNPPQQSSVSTVSFQISLMTARDCFFTLKKVDRPSSINPRRSPSPSPERSATLDYQLNVTFLETNVDREGRHFLRRIPETFPFAELEQSRAPPRSYYGVLLSPPCSACRSLHGAPSLLDITIILVALHTCMYIHMWQWDFVRMTALTESRVGSFCSAITSGPSNISIPHTLEAWRLVPNFGGR